MFLTLPNITNLEFCVVLCVFSVRCFLITWGNDSFIFRYKVNQILLSFRNTEILSAVYSDMD